MIHADRLAKAQHSLAVAAFAVCVHTCLRIYVSRLTSFSYTYVRAWLIAYAHKEEYSSAVFSNGLTTTNTLP